MAAERNFRRLPYISPSRSETFRTCLQASAAGNKDLNALKVENEALKAQLGEVTALRRKVAEMEVLRGQLDRCVAQMNQYKLQIQKLSFGFHY